eukprot:scaffold383885_cov31-Prasinocladus_malaysianus.AAC.2
MQVQCPAAGDLPSHHGDAGLLAVARAAPTARVCARVPHGGRRTGGEQGPAGQPHAFRDSAGDICGDRRG